MDDRGRSEVVVCKREGQVRLDRWRANEKERVVWTDVDRGTRAEGILMASFTPQQPSVLLEHLSGVLGPVDDHADTF